MATTLKYSEVKAWLEAQPENTASTPYEIIIKDAPSTGYKDAITRFVSIVGMEMSEGVTSIGMNAFRDCSSLTSVTIPEGVTSIGERAFQSCSSLTSVTIPEGVTSIGQSTFISCTNLASVTIPGTVTTIGKQAFQSCSGLTSITIPEGVTSIGESAFNYCTSLTSVAIPDGADIYYNAFQGCTKLQYTDTYYLPAKSGGTFLCKKMPADLTSFNVRGDCVGICSYAFSGCTSLTSVSIPNSVKTIGSIAFYNCTSLTSVTIPGSVTFMGKNVFKGCTGLTNVYMYPAFSETLMKSESFTGTPSNLNLYVLGRNLPGWRSATLTNYGFASGVVAKMMPAKKWVRVA